MATARAVGRQAAAMKYDLLTALGTYACAGDKHLQRLVLRFITLIVARYNWQNDELRIGQTEIAALWSVDPRTVKRDMARLRQLGWLVQKRPAARGRVAVHGLDLAAILAATKADWPRVGPDFSDRMTAPSSDRSAQVSNVVAFPGAPPPEGQGLWARAQAFLHRETPGLYSAWFATLHDDGAGEGYLRLRAPSRFHASFVTTHHLGMILAALQSLDPRVQAVEVTA